MKSENQIKLVTYKNSGGYIGELILKLPPTAQPKGIL